MEDSPNIYYSIAYKLWSKLYKYLHNQMGGNEIWEKYDKFWQNHGYEYEKYDEKPHPFPNFLKTRTPTQLRLIIYDLKQEFNEINNIVIYE